jgi:hypothetical protein
MTAMVLAERRSGIFQISLRWSRPEDRMTVVVENEDTEEQFELPARRDHALEVFYHPFAYMIAPR